MKKNYLKLISSFLFFLLVTIGCRKEVKDEPVNTGIQSQAQTNDERDNCGCRLIFGTNADPTGSANFTFHYNKKGLADKWDIENYGTLTQEYDARRRLKKSTLTQNGEVTNTISFFYNGGDKVTKQIWFYGTSTDTNEIMYYHYDLHGNLIKVQSFMNDWVAIGKYTPEGNLSESKLFFSGVPVYAALYTYNKPFKNPYLAVPGIDNLFPYYTPMDLFYGKWRWASLKQLAYDENGNPVVLFDYDASKTVWQRGPHDYPSSVNYFDLLSGGWFPYPFEFDNCDGRHDDYSNSPMSMSSMAPDAEKINTMMLLKHDSSKSMKEQVKEWRQQFKQIKNSGMHN